MKVTLTLNLDNIGEDEDQSYEVANLLHKAGRHVEAYGIINQQVLDMNGNTVGEIVFNLD